MKKLVVGIDPGKRGAIAFINHEILEAEVYSISDFNFFVMLLKSKLDEILIAGIEKQHSFPGQGVKSMFNLGFQYGMLIATLKILQIPFEEIPSQRWQKEMLGAGRKKKKEIKELSLQKAKNLFPKLALKIAKNHNFSDALLIAEYMRRNFKRSLKNE